MLLRLCLDAAMPRGLDERSTHNIRRMMFFWPFDLKTSRIRCHHTMLRALLAKDSLASVDGFRIMVLLAYEHLFGMRVCPNCPHCNHDEAVSPCQDLSAAMQRLKEASLAVSMRATRPLRHKSQRAHCMRIPSSSCSACINTSHFRRCCSRSQTVRSWSKNI